MEYSIGLDLPGAGEIMRMIMSSRSPGKVDGLALDFAIDAHTFCLAFGLFCTSEGDQADRSIAQQCTWS